MFDGDNSKQAPAPRTLRSRLGFAWPPTAVISATAARCAGWKAGGASARVSSGGMTRGEWTATTSPISRQQRPDAAGDPKRWRRSSARRRALHHASRWRRWICGIGLKDGPLPTHYEPLESNIGNVLYPNQATNPAADKKSAPTTPREVARLRYPYVHHVPADGASHRR